MMVGGCGIPEEFSNNQRQYLPGPGTCLWPQCCPGCCPPHSLPCRWSWSAPRVWAAGWWACRCRPPCCTRGPGHGSPPAPAPGPGDTRTPAWHLIMTSWHTWHSPWAPGIPAPCRPAPWSPPPPSTRGNSGAAPRANLNNSGYTQYQSDDYLQWTWRWMLASAVPMEFLAWHTNSPVSSLARPRRLSRAGSPLVTRLTRLLASTLLHHTRGCGSPQASHATVRDSPWLAWYCLSGQSTHSHRTYQYDYYYQ